MCEDINKYYYKNSLTVILERRSTAPTAVTVVVATTVTVFVPTVSPCDGGTVTVTVVTVTVVTTRYVATAAVVCAVATGHRHFVVPAI
jgi:hypothetical protein